MLPSHPGSYLQQTCQVRTKPAPSTHVGGSGECLIQTYIQPRVPGDTSFPPSTLMWSHRYLSLHLPSQICPAHTVILHHILPPWLTLHPTFSLPAPSTPLPCVVHTHFKFRSMLYICIFPMWLSWESTGLACKRHWVQASVLRDGAGS